MMVRSAVMDEVWYPSLNQPLKYITKQIPSFTILANINTDKLNVEENIARAYYQSDVLKLECYRNRRVRSVLLLVALIFYDNSYTHYSIMDVIVLLFYIYY
jgi:hypothetical protein